MARNSGLLLLNNLIHVSKLLRRQGKSVEKGKEICFQPHYRWHNHIDPDIKKEIISEREEHLIFEMHFVFMSIIQS